MTVVTEELHNENFFTLDDLKFIAIRDDLEFHGSIFNFILSGGEIESWYQSFARYREARTQKFQEERKKSQYHER